MTGMTPAFFCPAGFDQWANCLRNVTETKFTMKSLTGGFAGQRFLPTQEEPSARLFYCNHFIGLNTPMNIIMAALIQLILHYWLAGVMLSGSMIFRGDIRRKGTGWIKGAKSLTGWLHDFGQGSFQTHLNQFPEIIILRRNWPPILIRLISEM